MSYSATQNITYAIISNGNATTTTDINFQAYIGTVPGTFTYTLRGFWKVLRNGYGAIIYLPTKLIVSRLEVHRFFDHSFLVISPTTEVDFPRSRSTYPVYPSMVYGELPKTPPKIPKVLDTLTIRSTHKLLLLF